MIFVGLGLFNRVSQVRGNNEYFNIGLCFTEIRCFVFICTFCPSFKIVSIHYKVKTILNSEFLPLNGSINGLDTIFILINALV